MEDAEGAGGPARFSARQWMRITAERNLLVLMFQSEHWIEEVAKFLGPEDFEDDGYRQIYHVLVETAGRRDAEGRWLLEFPGNVAGDVETIRQSAEHQDWTRAEAFFAENMDRLLHRPA
jgi:DnaB-like helicase N terminal domain